MALSLGTILYATLCIAKYGERAKAVVVHQAVPGLYPIKPLSTHICREGWAFSYSLYLSYSVFKLHIPNDILSFKAIL